MVSPTEKIYTTPLGDIHYWLVRNDHPQAKTIVFLPGLTADHTLFVHQMDYFSAHYHVLVWDAPAHGKSRPFQLAFTMEDLARYLHGILAAENLQKPVLVGQSLGGYISQMYMDMYPEEVSHFVSVDSVSLQRKYYHQWEINFMRHTWTIYMCIPWKMLVKWGAHGTSQTPEGRENMKMMMSRYAKREYCDLVSFGYIMLANAIEEDRLYNIPCPALLICGEHDQAGSCIRYSRNWTKETGYHLVWIPKAGHNSNIDQPEVVNRAIEDFLNNHL